MFPKHWLKLLVILAVFVMVFGALPAVAQGPVEEDVEETADELTEEPIEEQVEEQTGGPVEVIVEEEPVDVLTDDPIEGQEESGGPVEVEMDESVDVLIEEAVEEPPEEPASTIAVYDEGDIEGQAYAGTYNTSWAVQNIGTGNAAGTITFHNKTGSAGAVPGSIDFTNLGPGAAVHYGSGDINVTSFDGAAVIQSDQEVAAVVRLEVNSTNTGHTNVGYARGYGSGDIASTLYAPSVYRHYFGYYSEISVQNAGSGANTVTLEFWDDTGQIAGTTPATLNFTNNGEVQRLDMADVAGLPINNADITSGGWVGVLKLVGTSDVAAQIYAYNLTQASAKDAFFHHDAVTAGSTQNTTTNRYEAYAPTVYNNVFGTGTDLGWSNSFQLVDLSGNTGQIDCNLTLNPLSISSNQKSLANQALDFTFFTAKFMPNEWGKTLGDNWVGTAKIDCDREFAGVVNLSYRRTSGTIKPHVSSQEMLFGGGTEIYYPDARVINDASLPGWASAVVVMNLGTQNVDVTLNGYDKGNTSGTADWTLAGPSELTITPGSGTGVFLSNTAYSATIPANFEGSVKVTGASAGTVVLHGCVNYAYNATETGADEWGVYTAFPK